MRKRRGFVPGLMARLEQRVVLSPGLAAAVGPGVAVAPQMRLDLRGTVTGAVRRDPSAADPWQLSGSGDVAPLGRVQVFGTLTIRPDKPSAYDGQLTLVARQGDVFVHIQGLIQGLGGGRGEYLVVGGTGAYRGATGRGEATFNLTPPVVFPPGPGRPYPRVMFTLKFGDVRGLEA